MESDLGFGLVALAVAAYGMTAVTLSRASVSAAFSFLVIGALIGGAGIGVLFDGPPERETISKLAEMTLALVLFSAASTVRLKRLEVDSTLVGRLLVIGLPLTIVTGTLLALGLFPGISFGVALLLGAILAPTDADLGHQVITDRSVPARIRRLLNVESGLNDGIAAPVVTVGLALATVGDVSSMNPLLDAIGELALAAVVGVAVGILGRWLLLKADLHHMTSPSSRQLSVLALALAAYLIAAGLGASGFIAAFVAGLAFGLGSKERVESAVSFTEAQSVLLSIFVWLAFGIVVFDDYVVKMSDPVVILYAVLSLTVIRMLPVAISLVGTRLDRVSVMFMGWFGPRGLASVVFMLLALDTLERNGVATHPLGAVVVWTVLLSVAAHGFSARPLARWYGRYSEGLPADSPEFLGDDEPHHRTSKWVMRDHGAEDHA